MLRGMTLCALVAGSACATVKPVSAITDSFCGYMKNYRICVAQYPEMEVSYNRTNDDAEWPLCSILVQFMYDRSVMLSDHNCDGFVDSYLEVKGDNKAFMNRKDDEVMFSGKFDPLYNKLRKEIMEATENEP